MFVAGSSFTVTASFADGSTATATASIGGGGGGGTGLRAQYYNDGGASYPLANPFTGTPALTRTDATVDFVWGGGSPGASVSNNNFSAKWTGKVKAPVTGSYTFTVRGDDGVRLFINGAKVLDGWSDHAAIDFSYITNLAAGTMYDIELQFYENGGDAECKLQWSYPGQPKQIIPQSQLFPAASYTLTVNNGSGDGSYTAGTQVNVNADVPPVDEEFVGPFPSWKNVKDFGAKGDGTTDDSNAIQAALNDLKPVMTNSYSVLYFPAGTYRITKTLVTTRVAHMDYQGFSIIGEDPANTTLVWDGAAGQIMISLDGWYMKVSRLTFDGKSKASVGLYRGDSFSTACELSDLRFRDMETGIKFGSNTNSVQAGQAEHAVLRNRFERMTKYGIQTDNFNTLDIWVWYNHFEDCNVGAHNSSGSFHIYRSVFLRSKVTDISADNMQSFAFVGNTSVGSKNFLNWAEQPYLWLTGPGSGKPHLRHPR